MPKARSTDAALHKVVADVGARPKDGYTFERAVINMPLKRVKSASGDIRRTGARTATVTATGYEWHQFQAITAEKVGDVYYLYANTYQYYLRGDARTPVKRWILSGRFQTTQILKENIGR